MQVLPTRWLLFIMWIESEILKALFAVDVCYDLTNLITAVLDQALYRQQTSKMFRHLQHSIELSSYLETNQTNESRGI